jgi:hypothetical protein
VVRIALVAGIARVDTLDFFLDHAEALQNALAFVFDELLEPL